MTTNIIRFFCPKCRSRVKAPKQLLGQKRKCPGCTHLIEVQHMIPEDAGPKLVLLEKEDSYVVQVA